MEGKWITIKSKGEKEARQEAIKKLTDSLGTRIEPGELVVQRKKPTFRDRLKGLEVFRIGLKAMEPGDVEINLDGYYKISFSTEGVFLKIFPPQGNGRPVDINAVKKEVERQEIQDVDWERVAEELQENNREGKEARIFLAERRPELDKDAEIQVRISSDGMEAFLEYFPPRGGEYLSPEKIQQELTEAGVVFGLMDEKLDEIAKSNTHHKEILIARGEAPVPGKDGYLEYHFKNEIEERAGKLREDGSVDHFNLDLIQNVKKGEPLVSVKPPVPGEPGRKVTGKEIKLEKPKEAKLPAGKNVEQDENGKVLLAGIEGQAVQESNGKVSVFPVHHVRGDVDLSTGHIDFLGTVIVDGNVTEGFKVEATGDVEVNGNVSAATIISGGNVKIRKGYLGKQKSRVECRENFEAKFIENGNVKAGGDVLVGEAILHSDISAAGKIVVQGKGLIAGGRIQAGQEVEVNVLGSSLATKTRVEVGVAPEVRTDLEEKLKISGELSDNLSKVEKAIRLLEKQKEKGILGEDRIAQLKKLAETWEQLKKRKNELEAEVQQIQEKIYSSEEGQVKINKVLFPGVTVVIAGGQHTVKDRRSRTRLVCSRGEIAYTTL